MVSDIDFFTYPQRYLKNQDLTDKELKRHREKFVKSKSFATDFLIGYAQKARSGQIELPIALQILRQIRVNRIFMSQRVEKNLVTYTQNLKDTFNIIGIIEDLKNRKFKQEILSIKNVWWVYKCYGSNHSVHSVTTLRSSANSSELSLIKC